MYEVLSNVHHRLKPTRRWTMSGERETHGEGRAIRVVDAARPGDKGAVVSTEIMASGKLGLPVLISPFQRDGRAAVSGGGGATASDASTAFQGFLVLHQEEMDDPATQRKKWFREMRGWLMVLATVAASVTYQAGLNPPGGFWQDDKDGHTSGNPVMHDKHHSRYQTFYYFNATAFITSLVIMVLLMSERFYHTEGKVMALMLTTFVDLASLVGAYIAGTTRYMSSCIYVIVITCVAFVSVIYIGEGMTDICGFFLRKLSCMRNLAKLNWLPVPTDARSRTTMPAEAGDGRRKTKRTCCLCCATSTDQRGDVEG